MHSATFDELCREGVLEIGDGYRAKNSELGGDGPIFLRSAYLQDHGFVREMSERFKVTGTAQFGSKASRLGDVVVTTKGNSTGRLGVIREDQVGAIYSPHLSYWRSLDAEKLDQRFLGYWAQTEEFKSQLGGMAYSTDMAPYLSLRDQRRLRISFPEIRIQRATTELLEALDNKIELNRRMNETLEAMAQGIFRDWFVDFGPTRRKLSGAADPVAIIGGLVQDAERAQVLADLFPATLGDDGLPEGWKLGVASSLVAFNPKEPLKKGTLAPYSDMSSLPTMGPLADTPVEREYGSGMRFRNGDALLARITPCLENGKSAFVDFLPDPQTVGWGSTEFYVLRSRKEVPAPFAYLLVRHPEFRSAAIASMTGTSGRQRAQVDRLEDFPFAEAPMEVLGEFGKFILPMFDKITANGGESRTRAATRDLLLPTLMSGETLLSEAEDRLEAAQ